jgi:hypothetical protein
MKNESYSKSLPPLKYVIDPNSAEKTHGGISLMREWEINLVPTYEGATDAIMPTIIVIIFAHFKFWMTVIRSTPQTTKCTERGFSTNI